MSSAAAAVGLSLRARMVALLCLVSSLLGLVGADYAYSDYELNHFLNPPTAGGLDDFKNNPVYEIGNILDIRWTTANFSSFTLTLWQAGGQDRTVNIFQDMTGIQEHRWTIDVIGFDIVGVNASTGIPLNVFYLYMYEPGNYSAGFTSLYFNLTLPSAFNSNGIYSVDATGATYFNSPTTVYSNPPSTYTSAPFLADPTSTPSSNVVPNSVNYGDDGAGTNTNLAFGLGLGLGIPVLIGLIFLCFFLQRKSHRNERANADTNANGNVVQRVRMVPMTGEYYAPAAQTSRPATHYTEHYAPRADTTTATINSNEQTEIRDFAANASTKYR